MAAEAGAETLRAANPSHKRGLASGQKNVRS